jgi:hypothetical protein
VPIVIKSGNLNLLKPSGPVQANNGIALPFYTLLIPCTINLFKKIRGRGDIIPLSLSLSLSTSTLRNADRLHVPAALPQRKEELLGGDPPVGLDQQIDRKELLSFRRRMTFTQENILLSCR